MDTATKLPLASRMGALAETGIDFRSTPEEARTTLHSLRQEYPELRKFLEHRIARLPEAQQQVVLALIEAAPAPDLEPLLQQWSRNGALPLHTRAQAIAVQEHGNGPVDTAYRDELVHAARLLHQLRTTEPSPLDEKDGIPWHNNTAERAIRHLARQREISGSFHESGARDYLVLLGIRQTCRSQGKSFFKFLLSGETDLDNFGSRQRQR